MRPVNLLPHDQRRRQPAGQLAGSAYVVIGVLGVLLVMAVAYVLTSNQLKAKQGDAAVARAEADQLEQQAQAQASFTDFAQIKQTRLASVAGVAQTRFDWERLMRELARIMPERSWLQSTDASVTGDPSGGGETTPEPGVAAQPTANLVGCTPAQSDVARMMVRLRELHRVEDVRLNESSKETGEVDSEATVDSCGSFYSFDLTVTFAAAAPASEAPRGVRGVPASLGGGS